jgi:hypothetical protein
MKCISYKITAIFLALNLVFSTISYAVEKHECGGKITDVKIFGESDKCSPLMEMEVCEIHSDKTLSFNKQICCKDLNQIIQSTIVIEKSTKNVDIQVLTQVTIIISKLYLFEGLAENIIPFQYYIPQKIITDIPVLYQTFLI